MKRLGLALAGVFVALALVSAPATAGKKDDTLVWATDRDNPIADPFFLNTRELVVIGHQAWDTLVIIDPKTSEIKPLLATKWAWVNPTTLEMELRKDVKFHSGQPMDADDVAYTLNFVSNKDNAISNYALLAFIKSAEKIDPYKVRITLHNPFPPALANLAGLGFIMQKGHYDKAPVKPDGKKDFGAVPPNGTGPYKITEVKPGQSILMVKNPDYFKGGYKGDPAISKILFRTIKDANTRAAELMTGAIDWLWDVPKDQAERLQANPALVVENAKTLRVSYLQFDAHGVSGQKFFTDKRVRQAVAHAINRESLTKNLVGPASVVAHSPCHPDQFGCSDKVTRYPYDPAKAKALLKEAGFPDGFEFDLFAYRDREYTEARHLVGEIVEHPHCGNGHGDTERGRDERFCDSGTDSADTGVLSLSKSNEGSDNTHNSSEQSDEWCGRTDGRKTGQTPLKLGGLNGDRPVKSTLRSFHLIGGNVGVALVCRELFKARGNNHSQVRILMPVADVDGFVDVAVLQCLCNFRRILARLLLGLVVCEPAFDPDGDQINSLNKENDDNDPARDR